MRALREHFPRPARAQPDLQIQVLDSLFFRNKAAYVIGAPDQRRTASCRSRCRSCRTSAASSTSTRCSSGEDQLLVLFSLARAYFFVDMEVPSAYVSFLRWLMPRKPRAELYTSVGLPSRARRSSTATCTTT